MPMEKLYKKIIQIAKEVEDLGLNGWQTEFTMTNKKKEIETKVKVNIRLKRLRNIKQKGRKGK